MIAQEEEERLGPGLEFPTQWDETGRPVRLEVLTYETQPCPPGFAEDLGIETTAPVRYIFRLRTAGAVPIALDHRYIPLPIAGGATSPSRHLCHAIPLRRAWSECSARLSPRTAMSGRLMAPRYMAVGSARSGG